LRETRTRCAWLRAAGRKFSTPRPRRHLRPPGPHLTVTCRRYLTGMNVRSCWIPTEVSFTTRQVKHHPHTGLTQRARRNAHTKSLSFAGESDAVKEEMKTKLNELIVSVFRKRPTLNYYQVQILLFQEGISTECQDPGVPRYNQCIVLDFTT